MTLLIYTLNKLILLNAETYQQIQVFHISLKHTLAAKYHFVTQGYHIVHYDVFSSFHASLSIDVCLSHVNKDYLLTYLQLTYYLVPIT